LASYAGQHSGLFQILAGDFVPFFKEKYIFLFIKNSPLCCSGMRNKGQNSEESTSEKVSRKEKKLYVSFSLLQLNFFVM
jgi:hypothetical protein